MSLLKIVQDIMNMIVLSRQVLVDQMDRLTSQLDGLHTAISQQVSTSVDEITALMDVGLSNLSEIETYTAKLVDILADTSAIKSSASSISADTSHLHSAADTIVSDLATCKNHLSSSDTKLGNIYTRLGDVGNLLGDVKGKQDTSNIHLDACEDSLSEIETGVSLISGGTTDIVDVLSDVSDAVGSLASKQGVPVFGKDFTTVSGGSIRFPSAHVISNAGTTATIILGPYSADRTFYDIWLTNVRGWDSKIMSHNDHWGTLIGTFSAKICYTTTGKSLGTPFTRTVEVETLTLSDFTTFLPDIGWMEYGVDGLHDESLSAPYHHDSHCNVVGKKLSNVRLVAGFWLELKRTSGDAEPICAKYSYR